VAGRLRGVGARIVAAISTAQSREDALDRPRHRLQADPRAQQHELRMVDVLLFAFEGKKALLAPLG
jgi:hypothetical protein